MIKYLTLFAVYLLDFTIHQRNLSKFFKKKINENINFIFDVGAHKGNYSKLFKSLFPNCHIYGFEPNLNLSKYLEKFDKSNYTFIRKAVSDTNGNIDMIIDDEISLISSAAKINYNSDTFKLKKKLYKSSIKKDRINTKSIDSITLDTFIEKNNKVPEFIKIDVEGFEHAVLKGLKNNINKIKFIMIEHHNDNLYLEIDVNDAHQCLLSNNFELLQSFKFPFMNWEDRIYKNKSI